MDLKFLRSIRSFPVALLLTGLAGCGSGTVAVPGGPSAVDSRSVFVMTNATAGNEVRRFAIAGDGTLSAASSTPTGGTGTGGGIENQGALALTEDRRLLLVVNPGSDDLSVFRVGSNDLTLVDRKPTGGKRPISVTVAGRVVYVLNAGGAAGEADTISGFRLQSDGTLASIPDSTRALGATDTSPAQLQLSPDGTVLVVVERSLHLLESFRIDSDGVAQAAVTTVSAGSGPFGFTFAGAAVYVSEAGTNSISSYEPLATGGLRTISAAVPTGQRAVCWLAVTPDGRFGYTANTASRTLTGFRINADHSVQLLSSDGVTASTTGAPFDLIVSADGRYLYVLVDRNAIEAFRIDSTTGALSLIQRTTGLPAGSNGIT